MERAAAQLSDGEGYTFDAVSVVDTADLAYGVGIECNRVKLGNATDKTPVSLRVTTIFRPRGRGLEGRSPGTPTQSPRRDRSSRSRRSSRRA